MSNAQLPSLSSIAQKMVIGSVYQHYKGSHYKVIALAFYEETEEELVVYQGENGITWARPLTQFVEEITMDGQRRQRFELV